MARGNEVLRDGLFEAPSQVAENMRRWIDGLLETIVPHHSLTNFGLYYIPLRHEKNRLWMNMNNRNLYLVSNLKVLCSTFFRSNFWLLLLTTSTTRNFAQKSNMLFFSFILRRNVVKVLTSFELCSLRNSIWQIKKYFLYIVHKRFTIFCNTLGTWYYWILFAGTLKLR